MPTAKPTTPAPEPAEPKAAQQDPTSDERPSKVITPKPRPDTGLAWLVLLGLFIVGAVPLLIDLNRPATWTAQESLNLAISTETHARKTPVQDAETSLNQWTPVYEGVSRWDLPPGETWLNQVMFTGVQVVGDTPNEVESKTLLSRARLGSVLVTLLFIGAVFWAGHTIGGVTTGTLSALAAMTMPLVFGFGRHATAHSSVLAWSTLSIAGALWAMRPLKATPSLARQLIGWLVCGVGLGLATLTMGPMAIPGTLLCAIAVGLVCPRRVGHLMGLLTASSIAALMLTPWILYVHDHDPELWQRWFGLVSPDLAALGWGESLTRAGWRLSLAAAYAGLWLIWLIPAATQLFSTSTGKARRKMLLGWVWLVTALVLVALAPGETTLAGLLLAVAPASVCIGQVIQQFHDLSSEARHARFWLIGRWLTCGAMLVLAIVLPLIGYLLHAQPELVSWLPSTDLPVTAAMHWSFYAGSGLALLLTSLLAIRFALAQHPGRTAASMALWLVITYSLAAIPIARSPMLSTAATPPASERPELSP